MTTDYNSLKVVELKDLLKARGLGVSGTKPELVARLEQNDAEKAEPITTAPVDDSTWVAVESTTTTTAPAKASSETNGEKTAKPDEPSEDDIKEDNQQIDSETQQVIAELEKRIKRAQRFGTSDDETVAQLKRVKRFGITDRRDINKILHGSSAKVSKPSTEDADKLKKRADRFGK